MFHEAEGRHARAFQADGSAITEKVRLYARVVAALIEARDNQQDAFDAITVVLPWERFLATVAEAGTLARPAACRRHMGCLSGHVNDCTAKDEDGIVTLTWRGRREDEGRRTCRLWAFRVSVSWRQGGGRMILNDSISHQRQTASRR
jgi:hypothetical protein